MKKVAPVEIRIDFEWIDPQWTVPREKEPIASRVQRFVELFSTTKGYPKDLPPLLVARVEDPPHFITLDGHHRRLAAILVGIKPVPALVVDWSVYEELRRRGVHLHEFIITLCGHLKNTRIWRRAGNADDVDEDVIEGLTRLCKEWHE